MNAEQLINLDESSSSVNNSNNVNPEDKKKKKKTKSFADEIFGSLGIDKQEQERLRSDADPGNLRAVPLMQDSKNVYLMSKSPYFK